MDGQEFKRDRWGRPLIIQPDGSEVPYVRASKVGSVLDDRYMIELANQRRVAKGMALREDLLLTAQAADLDSPEDKRELNAACKQAIEASGGSKKSTTGTAVHNLTAKHDSGKRMPRVILPSAKRDLDAYIRATQDIEYTSIERGMVCDELLDVAGLGAAGTPDRTGWILDPYLGRTHAVIDVKTGADADFVYGDWAVQLSIYAHAGIQDPDDPKKRNPVVPELNKEWAYVVSIKQGTGVCRIYRVDIAAGWKGAQLAVALMEYRKTTKSMAELMEETQ